MKLFLFSLTIGSLVLISCSRVQPQASTVDTAVPPTETLIPVKTPYPTYTPQPTYTLQPTYTPLPTYTSIPTVSPIQTPLEFYPLNIVYNPSKWTPSASDTVGIFLVNVDYPNCTIKEQGPTEPSGEDKGNIKLGNITYKLLEGYSDTGYAGEFLALSGFANMMPDNTPMFVVTANWQNETDCLREARDVLSSLK